MQDQYSRTQLLLGAEAMTKLHDSRVAVFGVGGVGGYTVEALARSGVGALDLIDSDTVDATNLNRQIIATVDAIGRRKWKWQLSAWLPSTVVRRAGAPMLLPSRNGQPVRFRGLRLRGGRRRYGKCEDRPGGGAFAARVPSCLLWRATSSIRRRFEWRTSTRPRSIRSPASCAANCVVVAFRR